MKLRYKKLKVKLSVTFVVALGSAIAIILQQLN